MNITSVTATPIRFSSDNVSSSSVSLIVRVQTDEGIEGVGECSGRYWQSLKPFIEDIAGPLIIGMDPRDTQTVWDAVWTETKSLGPGGLQSTGMGAIDVALWDIAGKAVKLPLYRLLGGAVRTHIQVYWSSGLGWQRTPDEMLDRVKEGWDLGYRAFKIRMDWYNNRLDSDPAKDMRLFDACRNFLPDDAALSFDANNGYTVSTAIQQGRYMESQGLAHFEEPLPQYDYLGLKQVVEALSVPVSSGENERSLYNFRDMITIGDPDIVQPDIAMAGGITGLRKVYTLCEAYNKPMMPHCPSAGISSAASLNLYATYQHAVRPHEYSYEFSGSLDAVAGLFQESIIPENGFIDLPDRPGHGLVLDEDAFKAAEAAF